LTVSKSKSIPAKSRKVQKPNLKLVSANVIVGKDILELLGSSMYVNPLTIYREYIQNAVDAIDEAVNEGLLKTITEGRIEINIDHIDRRVVIRDNGIGINSDEFETRMAAFGASTKRGTNARGFRGVGRLSGLGYCKELVFRSKGTSDNKAREIRWDCRRLKNLITDFNYDGNLNDLVNEIISINDIEAKGYPPRFFEVEIIKPRRMGNDVLLNEQAIEEYLAQHGPIPFYPKFKFGEEIRKSILDAGVKLGEYCLFLNGSKTPIYRPYRNEVAHSETKFSLCRKVESIEIYNNEGRLAAVGWVLHHDYQGSIPVNCGVRGLRARIGNIQIGDDRIFSDVYPEERFNSWTVGEVHIIDQRIIPNGRRDNFEPSTHFSNLTNQLKPHTADIAKKCRSSSQVRNRIKTFEFGEIKIEERLAIIGQGAISKSAANNLKKEIGTLLSEIRHAAGVNLLGEEIQKELATRANSLEKRVERMSGAKPSKDPLDHVQKSKRQVYKKVFELIYECTSNSVVAKSLIDKILARISKT
jgi:molecular chaperone HtpG